MTIAALRAIQNQEFPEVHRRPALRLPHQPATAKEAPAMPTTPMPPAAAASTDTVELPVGQLLAWAHQHEDPKVQDQGAQVRAALAGLRQRHEADTELAAITTEAEQLERRLAELRAREAELAPPKPKTKRKAVAYPAAEVRAWARINGMNCPATGRIPGIVVDAWRRATGATENEAR